MRYAYPCDFQPYEGGFVVSFPDVPEAITGGETIEESVELAADALAIALAGYFHERRTIPEPSEARLDQRVVSVPPVVAAKLALYRAMREQKITNVGLDPDHRSHIGQVQIALKALDRVLVIEDRAA